MPNLIIEQKGTPTHILEVPDGWVEEVQGLLRKTPFEGLVARLDPYKDCWYAGKELISLSAALAEALQRGNRFTAETRLLMEEIILAEKQGLTVLFSGD